METSGNFEVNSSIDKVWDVISDPNKFAKCLPNVTSTEVNGDSFNLQFKADAKKYTAKFIGASYLSNLNIKFSADMKERQEKKHILIAGSGSTIGLKFSLSLYVDMEEKSSSTAVKWKAEIELGKMAKLFGNDTVQQAVNDIVKQTIDNLQDMIKQ